jgi:protein PsiE
MIQQHNRVALRILQAVENLGLAVILVATVLAGYQEVGKMLLAHQVGLADLLLLFLYLEIITMLGLYYREGKLPVRYPIYIAIVALARYIVLGMKEMDSTTLVAITGSVVLLTVALLLLRYGQHRFPYREPE